MVRDGQVGNQPFYAAIGVDQIGRRDVLGLWAGVAACCALATVAGTLLADAVSRDAQAFVDGFAAGALLTMLIDSMVPEAKEKARDWAGLATVAGFALAAGLSLLGG